MQLAKAKGTWVAATCSGDDVDFLRDLGVDKAIDYKTQRFEDEVSDIDLVYDLTAGETQEWLHDEMERKPPGEVAHVAREPRPRKCVSESTRNRSVFSMASGPTRSTVKVADHPIYAMLVPIPFVCFLITVFTDWAYAETADMQWANMSAWLLAGGLVVSIVVVIAGLVDFFSEPSLRASLSVWIHGVGYAIALLLSIFNAFVHSRDAYTSVVPTGLILSVIVAIILLVSAWSGWSVIFRQRDETFAERNR